MDAPEKQACTVYVTCPDVDEARRLARAAVEANVAACANVIGGAVSVYRWQGAVHEDAEAVLLLKTVMAEVPTLSTLLRSLHSYDTPCIVVWPIVAGDVDYLAWIRTETAGE